MRKEGGIDNEWMNGWMKNGQMKEESVINASLHRVQITLSLPRNWRPIVCGHAFLFINLFVSKTADNHRCSEDHPVMTSSNTHKECRVINKA